MSRFHVSKSGEVLPCRAKPGMCPLESIDGQAHGSEEEVYAALASQYNTFTASKKSHRSEGSKKLVELIKARENVQRLSEVRRSHGGSINDLPPDLRAEYDAAVQALKDVNREIRQLPWDENDAPEYSDEPIDFMKSDWRTGSVRRGLENDLGKLGPAELEAFKSLDSACEVWVSRLSTAEVKALHAYVTDAQSYAESMAASNGFAAKTTNSFKYLHTALEKAPLVKSPIVVYAGLSSQRVEDFRADAQTGTVSMNRVQSTSLNPAMVNSFMRPSSWDAEDHTALEIKTNRVASLSLFHLREEMEVLLPPQDYTVRKVERGVKYVYPDGYSYEPSDHTYKLEPAKG